MISGPAVTISIVTCLAGISIWRSVGSIAGKTFACFLVFSTLALIIGIAVANLTQPGAGPRSDAASFDAIAVAGHTANAHDTPLSGNVPDILRQILVSRRCVQAPVPQPVSHGRGDTIVAPPAISLAPLAKRVA